MMEAHRELPAKGKTRKDPELYINVGSKIVAIFGRNIRPCVIALVEICKILAENFAGNFNPHFRKKRKFEKMKK